jgi:tetratricopeptide (TPR) repeat protein
MTGQQLPAAEPIGTGRCPERWRALAVCLGLAAITWAVFGQTLAHEFINYDDNVYVYENEQVAGGLSLKGLAWVFTHPACYLYHPLTLLSLMADHQLCRLHPAGYHFTNVALHTASVLILFLLLRHMTGAFWRSAFVAALFAIHPLRVESVAWVAERKDVLSGLFFLLTLAAYLRYVRQPPAPGRYLLVAGAFLLALLCKPTVVTLPFVLLLLDYWPLRRFAPPATRWRLVLEKIPLLALAVASSIVTTLVVQAAEKSAGPVPQVPLLSRFGNALVSYAVYLRQMLWPQGLAMPYPHPQGGLPLWEEAAAGALLAGLSAVAWGWRRTRPWLLAGWLWYLGMLMPMIGILQATHLPHADRYTYLPQIGVYLALTWEAAERAAKWRVGRTVVASLAVSVIVVLMVCAWKQAACWKNSETLWNRALACTVNNYVANYNLGDALVRKGAINEGIACYQKALELKPDYAGVENDLGAALFQEGRVDEAISHYQKALGIRAHYAEARNNLGNAWLQKGKVDNALAEYRRAVEDNPGFARARLNLATVLLQTEQWDNAIAECRDALQFNPDSAEARNILGNAWLQKGEVDDAIAQFRKALELEPGYAEAHNSLGNALLQKGRADEAMAHFQTALLLNPRNAKAHNNLGNAFLRKGRMSDAIAHFQSALRIEPNELAFQNNLAWALATAPEASLRDGAKAVELARQANAATGGNNPTFLHTLAAAYAEAGRFPEALEAAQRALALAGARSNTTLAARLQSQIKLYQAGKPFRLVVQPN